MNPLAQFRDAFPEFDHMSDDDLIDGLYFRNGEGQTPEEFSARILEPFVKEERPAPAAKPAPAESRDANVPVYTGLLSESFPLAGTQFAGAFFRKGLERFVGPVAKQGAKERPSVLLPVPRVPNGGVVPSPRRPDDENNEPPRLLGDIPLPQMRGGGKRRTADRIGRWRSAET